MSTKKEFEGKTLDDAINAARAYFGVEREKLEVEIVNDAQGGIFGLMGAKKAKIRAGKACLPSLGLLDEPEEAAPAAPRAAMPPAEEKKPAPRKAKPEGRPEAKPEAKPEGRGKSERTEAQPAGKAVSETRAAARPEPAERSGPRPGSEPQAEPRPAPRSETQAEPRPAPRSETRAESHGGPRSNAPRSGGHAGTRHEPRHESRPAGGHDARAKTPRIAPRREETAFADARDELPDLDIAALDPALITTVVSEVVARLVGPIVGEVPIEVTIADGRAGVSLDCGDASGLLVGRDGQTLAAIQYLASRITAKRLGGNFRLFIDAGNYRERQEDKLRELALELAERACKTGRPQSTRPMSAYQRRVIHLTLESHQSVNTCSKGDGLQRRVVVQPKRLRPGKGAEEAAPADSGPAGNAAFDLEEIES